MKDTAAQSAKLKLKFKDHFRLFGYDGTLPLELSNEREHYPLEWSEACQEYEKEDGCSQGLHSWVVEVQS